MKEISHDIPLEIRGVYRNPRGSTICGVYWRIPATASGHPHPRSLLPPVVSTCCEVSRMAMVLRGGRLIQAPAGTRAARGLARASLPLARVPWRADVPLRSMSRQTPT